MLSGFSQVTSRVSNGRRFFCGLPPWLRSIPSASLFFPERSGALCPFGFFSALLALPTGSYQGNNRGCYQLGQANVEAWVRDPYHAGMRGNHDANAHKLEYPCLRINGNRWIRPCSTDVSSVSRCCTPWSFFRCSRILYAGMLRLTCVRAASSRKTACVRCAASPLSQPQCSHSRRHTAKPPGGRGSRFWISRSGGRIYVLVNPRRLA